ncbi:hypothetical protein FKQ62_15120 [Vibrio sp. B1-2]|uniref:c-type cytochrome n=1 Tax=Vibrio sp. B1-2 TaxID=2591465 RepID=UPI001482766D|nr:c-type cytochrome [Vibrio sp. B1-2]NNO00741.1 hypothetical protein [Vibrio sp. B1-2]
MIKELGIIALAYSCDVCHQSQSYIPNLDSQSPAYIERRLHHFKINETESIMGRITQGLNEEEIKLLSVFFGDRSSSVIHKKRYENTYGKEIYEIKCKSCHNGSENSINIQIQGRGYLVRTITNFIYEDRYMPDAMRINLLSLSEDELSLLLDYLSK